MSWTIIFGIALFNKRSTFETIVVGFERMNNTRTQIINDLLIKKSIDDLLFKKRSNIDENFLNKEIFDLQKDRVSTLSI